MIIPAKGPFLSAGRRARFGERAKKIKKQIALVKTSIASYRGRTQKLKKRMLALVRDYKAGMDRERMEHAKKRMK
jgi:hypothetical protein